MNIDKIKEIQYPMLYVPFHGEQVEVIVRELTQAQIIACGGDKFSLISTIDDKIRAKKKVTMKDRMEYAAMQAKIAKKSLIKPTYDEIFDICKVDVDIDKIKHQMEYLDSQMALIPDCPKRQRLEEKFNSLRVWFDLILPEDFLAAITCYALGIDKSDIKEVTIEALINAAVLAKQGNDNPSDHLDGTFTAFMKDDINNRAWAYYYDMKKKNRKSR